MKLLFLLDQLGFINHNKAQKYVPREYKTVADSFSKSVANVTLNKKAIQMDPDVDIELLKKWYYTKDGKIKGHFGKKSKKALEIFAQPQAKLEELMSANFPFTKETTSPKAEEFQDKRVSLSDFYSTFQIETSVPSFTAEGAIARLTNGLTNGDITAKHVDAYINHCTVQQTLLESFKQQLEKGKEALRTIQACISTLLQLDSTEQDLKKKMEAIKDGRVTAWEKLQQALAKAPSEPEPVQEESSVATIPISEPRNEGYKKLPSSSSREPIFTQLFSFDAFSNICPILLTPAVCYTEAYKAKFANPLTIADGTQFVPALQNFIKTLQNKVHYHIKEKMPQLPAGTVKDALQMWIATNYLGSVLNLYVHDSQYEHYGIVEKPHTHLLEDIFDSERKVARVNEILSTLPCSIHPDNFALLLDGAFSGFYRAQARPFWNILYRAVFNLPINQFVKLAGVNSQGDYSEEEFKDLWRVALNNFFDNLCTDKEINSIVAFMIRSYNQFFGIKAYLNEN